jgi:hypothetical protein
MNVDRLIEQYYPILIPLFWIFISCGVATLSGWRILAEAYPLLSDPTGEKLRFQSATLRWSSNYTGIVHMSVNHQGLVLSVFAFFRPGHAPMFIPWGDILAEAHAGLIPSVTLRFARRPKVPLIISKALAEKLAGMSGGRFNVSSL